jgi:predicted dehydrogenase
MPTNRWSRRDVLRVSSQGLMLPLIMPRSILGLGGVVGANETVHVGIIGLGGRARALVNESRDIPDMRVVAVCDCFRPAVDRFIADVGQDRGWRGYDDFQEMLDKEKLDAVMVVTTTHARAWVAAHVIQRGLHVYIEKPMCLTVAEGRYLVNAARRYKVITQVGTQQRSMPINNWASDLVKNGAIGKVRVVLAPNFVGPLQWPGKPERPLPPGGRDNWWDVWLNQAQYRPYHPELHHNWAAWWDYDGGGLCYGVTGWGTHSYDQIQRALGTDDTGPVEILLEEPVKDSPTGRYATMTEVDETRLDYLIQLAKPVVGPRAKMRMWYANGTELRLHLDGDWGPGLGAIFIGEKGKIEINRNKIASNPKEIVNSAENPGPITKPETQYHIENWIHGIKTGERCTADVEIGHRSTTLCLLVNIVREVGRVGERLRWDPVAERFTNCEEANKSSYMDRERRKGYELPPLT